MFLCLRSSEVLFANVTCSAIEVEELISPSLGLLAAFRSPG